MIRLTIIATIFWNVMFYIIKNTGLLVVESLGICWGILTQGPDKVSEELKQAYAEELKKVIEEERIHQNRT